MKSGLALEERGSNVDRWKAPDDCGVKTPVKRRLTRRKCPRARGLMCADAQALLVRIETARKASNGLSEEARAHLVDSAFTGTDRGY